MPLFRSRSAAKNLIRNDVATAHSERAELAECESESAAAHVRHRFPEAARHPAAAHPSQPTVRIVCTHVCIVVVVVDAW